MGGCERSLQALSNSLKGPSRPKARSNIISSDAAITTLEKFDAVILFTGTSSILTPCFGIEAMTFSNSQ